MSGLVFATLLVFSPELHAQEPNKTQEYESNLIDAMKEEQIGNPEKAIAILEKLRYEPGVSGTANYYLARIYAKSGRMEEALICIDISTKAEPENKWFLVMKANLLEKTGRNDQVAACYQQLARPEANNYNFYENAALYYMRAEKPVQALHMMDLAHQVFGPVPALILRKVDLLLLQNKTKQAIESLNLSIGDYPRHTELYTALAEIDQKQGKTREYSQTLDRLRAVQPDHPLLRPAEEPVNKEADAEQFEQKIKSREWSLDEGIQSLIPATQDLNENSPSEKVQQLLQKARLLSEVYPGDPKPYALMGDICFQTNQILPAAGYYKKSCSLGQVPYSVWDHLLFTLYQLNHWNSLIRYANQVLELYPNQAYPYFALAEAFYRNEKTNEAKDQINQYLIMARKQDIRRASGLVLLAKIQAVLKDQSGSEQSWNKALEIADSRDYVQAELLLHKARTGQPYEVSTMEEIKKSKLPVYHYSRILAEIMLIRGNFREAANQIDVCLSNTLGKSVDNYLLAAKIYHKLGNTDQSRKLLEEARAISEEPHIFNPDNLKLD